MIRKTVVLASILLIAGLTLACGAEEAVQNTREVEGEVTGELGFTANGEDFVRSGFVSSDGWHITFRHVYVTITDVTAYQTDPPYDPHTGEEIISDILVELDGVFTVDLAEGDEDAEPVLVGILESVPTGHYNALSWSMVPAAEGASQGYTVYIDAQAEKGDQSYNVFLGFEESYRYNAGEYVGDVRKGFVTEEEAGDLEMTFHFDHIFGDIDQPADSDLNMMAIGFEPFAELMHEGTVFEDLLTLFENLPEETFTKLQEVLPTLGHTGEGHCHCTVIQ